jgi:hypothetical protein
MIVMNGCAVVLNQDRKTVRSVYTLSEIAKEVMRSTAEMYKSADYQPPWVGYFAFGVV